jgi:hypothetical protein
MQVVVVISVISDLIVVLTTRRLWSAIFDNRNR